MAKCSIIIRSYNEEQHIERLLCGITEQQEKDVEIIIVDSGSNDATLDIAQRFSAKIVIIKQKEFSFGRALNKGCCYANGKYLVFASAHVYPVYKDWLTELIAPFKDDKIALVYGKQSGDSKTKYSEHQIFRRWFPTDSNMKQDNPFCNNANAAIRRELWDKVKYDEELTGLEDLDWSNKVMGLGYSIAYNSNAEVIHVHRESLKQIYNRYRREAIAFKKVFRNVKFGFREATFLLLKNIANDYVCAAKDKVIIGNLLDIPLFRMMQLWGTYKGHKQHRPITDQLKRTFYYPRADKTDNVTNSVRSSERMIDYAKEQIY